MCDYNTPQLFNMCTHLSCTDAHTTRKPSLEIALITLADPSIISPRNMQA